MLRGCAKSLKWCNERRQLAPLFQQLRPTSGASNQVVGSSNLSGRATFPKVKQAVSVYALAAFFFKITSAGLLRDPSPTIELAAPMRLLSSAAE